MDRTLSIIIPVFNTKEYLGECVDSILRQDFGDFELLLVDDGSTDGSGRICDEYAKNYPERIRVFHKENGGVSSARNLGLENARGKYIAFADSDDTVLPGMYSSLLPLFDGDDGTDIVIGNVFTSEKDRYETTFRGLINRDRIRREVIVGKIREDCTFEGQSPYKVFVYSCIYKKSIIDENVLRFPRLKIGEDMIFLMQYLLNCEKAFFTGESCYYYRQRPGSAVRSYIPDYTRVHDEYLLLANEILKRSGLEQELCESTYAEGARVCSESEIFNLLAAKLPHDKKRIELSKIAETERYRRCFRLKHLPLRKKITHSFIRLKLYRTIVAYYSFRFHS